MTVLQTEALTTDALVQIAREQIEAFNSGDWEQMGGLLASDARYHEFGTERVIEGPEQIIEAFKGWKAAFPDAAGTVTSSAATGDTVVLEVTWKGTHTGPLTTAAGTIPASGKSQETPAAVFYVFEGAKIKASRHYFDALTLLKQIGAEAKQQ
jgi:steroid delta-isomerase-like uncharacterized protein